MCLIVCLLLQAAFYCLACSCYVNSFAGLEAHTATKRHKNNVLEADILQFSKFFVQIQKVEVAVAGTVRFVNQLL
jgi:hypothetical protein